MESSADFIEVFDNALPDTLCDRLIDTFEQHPGVFEGRTGNGVDLSKKVSQDLMLDSHPELADLKNDILAHTLTYTSEYFKKFYLALIGAVSVSVPDGANGVTTLTPDNFAQLGEPRLQEIVRYLYRSGTINIQKYLCNKGGYPHWHSEQFPQLEHAEALHRVVLYMYYLNDVFEGGETEFYYQQRQIKPKKGTMVIAPAGFTHSHRGKTPTSGDKYIATSWIMFNPATKIYGAGHA